MKSLGLQLQTIFRRGVTTIYNYMRVTARWKGSLQNLPF